MRGNSTRTGDNVLKPKNSLARGHSSPFLRTFDILQSLLAKRQHSPRALSWGRDSNFLRTNRLAARWLYHMTGSALTADPEEDPPRADDA